MKKLIIFGGTMNALKKKSLTIIASLLLLLYPLLSYASGGGDINEKMMKLVVQLAVIVVAARLCGFFFTKYLKQPAVLGELCAGLAIGPYALGGVNIPHLGSLFEKTQAIIPVSPELYGFATVAAIILLFLAGLETNLKTFLKYSFAGGMVGIGGVVGSFLVGDVLAVLFNVADGYFSPTALFLGAICTATSVGITARILSEKRKLDSPEGVTIIAGAVIDDVLGIIVLAIVVGLARAEGAASVAINWSDISFIALKAFGFWIFFTLIGILLANKIGGLMKRFRSPEVMAALALGLAFFLSALSEASGLAMIIGAYIMGLALSRTDIANEIHDLTKGVYNFFVPIFFCVMGMLVDFSAMKGVLVFGAVYTLFSALAKVFGCAIPALLMKFNLRGAMRIGIGMMPRGEVALIIAGIGITNGIISTDVFGVSIMMTLVTTLITPPFLVKLFEGPDGIITSKQKSEDEEKVTYDFGDPDVAEFALFRFIKSLNKNNFFVHKVSNEPTIYQARKDSIALSILPERNEIVIEVPSQKDSSIKLFIDGEMSQAKTFLSGVK